MHFFINYKNKQSEINSIRSVTLLINQTFVPLNVVLCTHRQTVRS